MTYNEFKQELMGNFTKKVKNMEQVETYKFYEDGYCSNDEEERRFIKATNIKYNKVESDVLIGDFLNIQLQGVLKRFARIAIKYLYEGFEEAGWNRVWEIIDENIRFAAGIDLGHLTESLTNYEGIKDRLVLRPLNFTDNRYELKDCIYRRVGDIALVLYVVVSSDANGINSFKAKKSLLKSWDREENEIMEEALINTNVYSVPRMYNLNTISNHPKYETGAYMALGSTCRLSALGSTTFTTFPQLNGAISFWYPGVQEKIAEMAGGDYYIAFTGIHDFHIHPVSNTGAREVLSNLKEMNRINPPGETLSRKVYRYNVASKELIELAL
jgi:hypothetical protein